MIPCDYRQEARSGVRARFSLAGGDCRPRGFFRIRRERLLGHHQRTWKTLLWFLGWDRTRPDCNTTFLAIMRAGG